MSEADFKKECEALIRKRLPRKIKVAECIELLWRLWQARAVDNRSTVSTTKISKGIKRALGHLLDMERVGLVKKKSNDPTRFFLDARIPSDPHYPKGDVQIDLVREENISELLRHMEASAEVKKLALATVSASTLDEFTSVVESDDNLFNAVVEAIETAGLRDGQYLYGIMGWRTGSFFWRVTDEVPTPDSR